MVSKAFQVLSDPNLRAHYDRTGMDPESRASAASSSFSSNAGGHPGFSAYPQANMSPEDLFNSFFGDQFFSGPGTFFFGGGPGIRVHQFGGRPRNFARRQQAQDMPPKSIFYQLLPLIVVILFAFLSNFSWSDSTSVNTRYSFQQNYKYTVPRTTAKHNIPYYMSQKDLDKLSSRDIRRLNEKVEHTYTQNVHNACLREQQIKEDEIRRAQGWFFPDKEALKKAKELRLPNCDELNRLGYRTYSNSYYF